MNNNNIILAWCYQKNKEMDLFSTEEKHMNLFLVAAFFASVNFCCLVMYFLHPTQPYSPEYLIIDFSSMGTLILGYLTLRIPYKLGFYSNHEFCEKNSHEKVEVKQDPLYFDFKKMDSPPVVIDPKFTHLIKLGLTSEATWDDIKQAYRRFSMKYHPDRNIGRNTEAQFKRIQHAYSELKQYYQQSLD